METKITTYKARWIYPVDSPPMENGWVGVSGGKIISVGRGKAPAKAPEKVLDLGEGVILPALINAHTHLELSALKGRIAPGLGFLPWVKQVLSLRGSIDDQEGNEAIRRSVAHLHQKGIVALGDWNSFLRINETAWPAGTLRYIFHEVIGFSEEKWVLPAALALNAEGRRPNAQRDFNSIGAHAPHTTSARLLQSAKEWTLSRGLPLSIHTAESREEEDFFLQGGGPWQALLKDLGRWPASWTTPGISSVAYLDRLGLLDEKTQCVHLTRAGFEDLKILKNRGAQVVVCPRSNVFITGTLPPLPEMLRLGLNPALGTDSLASNQDLDLWEEMGFLSRSFPSMAPEIILQMATLNGARSLGLEDRLGSISPGKRASMLFLPRPVRALKDLAAAILDGRGQNLQWIPIKE